MENFPKELNFSILEKLDFQALPAAITALAQLYTSQTILDNPAGRRLSRIGIFLKHYTTLWVQLMGYHLSDASVNDNDTKPKAMERVARCLPYFDDKQAETKITLFQAAQCLYKLALRIEKGDYRAKDAAWLYKCFDAKDIAYPLEKKLISAAALGCKTTALSCWDQILVLDAKQFIFLPEEARFQKEKERSLLLQAALVEAHAYGHAKVVQILVHKGADLNMKDNEGWTPLYRALRSQKLDLADLLIKNGADLNIQDTAGNTLLNRACESGDLDLVRLLIEKGADVNVPNIEGCTPIYWACINGERELAQLLIEEGADLRVRDQDGWTPLCWACIEVDLDLAKLLIDHGADLNAQDNEGFTALDRASKRGDLGIVQLLRGAPVKMQNITGHRPF